MKLHYQSELLFVLLVIVVGQLLFALTSHAFTKRSFDNRIYATTGIMHEDTSDLQKLNEAAHYFGQTMIGWTKFPHFMEDLIQTAGLPEGSTLNGHMQERQNIIFTVNTPVAIDPGKIITIKDFIQGKMDDYNELNKTKFVLSNLDYEQVELQKTYRFGATVSLIASVVLGLGLLFIRKEFF